jgi:hypothetical protein
VESAAVGFPNPNEYAEAVQYPKQAFNDPDLRDGKIVTNRLGLPRPISGNFATVFEIIRGDRRWAVRCFVRDVPHLKQRYAAISAHLRRHALPYMVNFEYLPQGVRVRGKWFPVLKMDWMEGSRLDSYLEDHLRDSGRLAALATQWAELTRSLRASGIAHGDLQHGNILITNNDEIKLIDYDGMYIPDVIGLGSAEVGHRHYQHPTRRADDGVTSSNFGNIDNFSAQVIGVSLSALSIDPSLWKKTKAGEENLLFRDDDYLTPQRSASLRLFQKHDDTRIRQLGAQMLQAVQARSYLDVPPLDGASASARPKGFKAWLLDTLAPTTNATADATTPVNRSSWVFDHLGAIKPPPFEFSAAFIDQERRTLEADFERSMFRYFRSLFREYATIRIAERFPRYPLVIDKVRIEETYRALDRELGAVRARRKTLAKALGEAQRHFDAEQRGIETAIQRLTADLQAALHDEEREVAQVERQMGQLQRVLQRRTLEAGSVPGIGRVRVEMLAQVGIRSAADVTPANGPRARHVLSGVRNAAPQRDWAMLVAWREGIERGLLGSSAAPTARTVYEVRTRYAEQRQAIEAARAQREAELNGVRSWSPHLATLARLSGELQAVDAEIVRLNEQHQRARSDLDRYERITLRQALRRILG